MQKVTGTCGHPVWAKEAKLCRACYLKKKSFHDAGSKRAWFRGYYKRNPDKYAKYVRRAKEHNRIKRYGVTPEMYAEMLVAQDNRCAVCRLTAQEAAVHPPELCVDHNHTTGKVRGLLCVKCNTALGNANDSIVILERLIDYLARD